MFVYLGQAVGEVVFLMEDRVGVGQLYPFEFGKDFFHLFHGELFEAVVVVDMEETAAEEVGAEVVGFLSAEGYVAVSGDVDVWVVEQVAAAYINGGVLRCKVHVELRVAECDEVRKRCGVGVPVAASVVFQQSDGSLCMGGDGGEEQRGKSESEMCFFHCCCWLMRATAQTAVSAAVSVRRRLCPRETGR